MSDYAKEYEQRQRHLASLQDDADWQRWLSFHEDGLRTFFTEVVPDMPSDPYTEVGARHAEAAALRLFPDEDAADPALSPDSVLEIDAYHRYIGELAVRNFEGRWVFDDSPSDSPEPVVELPYSTAPIVPRTLLITLAFRRSGDELAFIVREQTQAHRMWVDAGRPALPEWRRIKSKMSIEQLLQP